MATATIAASILGTVVPTVIAAAGGLIVDTALPAFLDYIQSGEDEFSLQKSLQKRQYIGGGGKDYYKSSSKSYKKKRTNPKFRTVS